MLHIMGARRKFKIASERLTSPQHAEKRKPEDQRKEDAGDDGPVHASAPLQSPFIKFDHVSPGRNRWQGTDRRATLDRDVLHTTLESLVGCIVLRPRG